MLGRPWVEGFTWLTTFILFGLVPSTTRSRLPSRTSPELQLNLDNDDRAPPWKLLKSSMLEPRFENETTDSTVRS